MGFEKQSSKGVGGFFQLFDWNAKSRKKLFSSKPDLPEKSKQKKRSDENLPMTRLHLMDEDELAAGSSFKGSSDYSCASSVTDDYEEGCGSKAPSVVARLMGLDSLPTSNPMDPYSTPCFDSQSLQNAHYCTNNLENRNDYYIIDSWNLPQKIINVPIEKFQTEVLPPKSAKSIPSTHHKLLSPFKSPGFIPSNNAAHIMEAAAKIIEPGPRDAKKTKTPLFGSSSVPLKVREFKEKVEASKKQPSRLAEASKRPVESNAAKYLKGQSMNRVSSNSEECSAGLKKNGKSISLALQAKANVQKREGLLNQKKQNGFISSSLFEGQPKIQKSTHKKPTRSASSVLKQNNQKQNCTMDRQKLPSKLSVSNTEGRKLTGDSSFGRHKSKYSGNSKVGSKKLGLDVVDSKKEVAFADRENVSRKKRSLDGSFHIEKNRIDPIQSKPAIDWHFSWAEDRKMEGTDVVSFTFTAPLTRSILGSETSRQVAEKSNGFSADYVRRKVLPIYSDSPNNSKSSSRGYNVIGGDALSVLLEQKIRELTHGVESSRSQAGSAGSSASIYKDLSSQDGTEYSSADQRLVKHYKLRGVEVMDECSTNADKAKRLLNFRHPSPTSVLEPSFFTESCNSSADSYSTEGISITKQFSSVQAQEVFGSSSLKKFRLVEAGVELSDSASSTSTRTHLTTVLTDFVGSTSWEFEYVKEILCNVELMFKDFALGRARQIINPHLFDLLESRKCALKSHGNESKRTRKIIFDCVSECMDLKCRRYTAGGSRKWSKGVCLVRRKERLAEEVCKEILGWRGLRDCLVDEIVDKDMSSQYGRWVDFESEAFELGVEIEKKILSSLIDEVVDDVLLV